MPAQVVPTGPFSPEEMYRRVFLAAIGCARKQVTLTTPYFVPDEATLLAVQMACARGVEVTLIVPARGDHAFTAAVGRAHFAQLMQAGVQIYLFRKGLVHAKTVTIDDAFAIVGSANLDVRSFNLNFELSVILYGGPITQRVREAQGEYVKDSDRLDPAVWERRSRLRQYADSAVALLSPLL